MAEEKKNKIGTKKSFLDYMLADRKCLQCRVELSYNDFQIDHVTPKKYFLDNGLAIDSTLSNLACLCKRCNSAKGEKGIEFYGESQQKFIRLIADICGKENDIRNILRENTLPTFDGGNITAVDMTIICDDYAILNPTSKFAKLHRNGIFWISKNA